MVLFPYLESLLLLPGGEIQWHPPAAPQQTPWYDSHAAPSSPPPLLWWTDPTTRRARIQNKCPAVLWQTKTCQCATVHQILVKPFRKTWSLLYLHANLRRRPQRAPFWLLFPLSASLMKAWWGQIDCFHHVLKYFLWKFDPVATSCWAGVTWSSPGALWRALNVFQTQHSAARIYW